MERGIIAAVIAMFFWPATVAAAPAEAYDCGDAKALPPDASQDDRRIACTIPAEYRFNVSVAEYIGKTIRRHDMAAWLTTDAVRDAGLFNTITGNGRGWLTEEREDSVWTGYFTEVDGQLAVFAEARMYWEPFGARDVQAPSSLRPASESQRRRLQALALARSQPYNTCTDAHYNTVTFEVEEDGEVRILVFLMPPMEDTRYHLGGYHMFRATADGTRVLDHFAQTRGCIELSPENMKVAQHLVVSHELSATPTMFHVFMSLQYRKPLVVLTTQNDRLWRVDSGRIDVLRTDDPLYKKLREWADTVETPHQPVETSSHHG
ncbi:hypothetical protein LJR143_001262 [Pseudoxanthomonas sp. LjRoot143]|uniref:hypothetical protein n=1 Tax=Pseudoxanthomonas sp. LjRoot143 TaxID=3342266 RepID=UPI003ED0AC66